MPTDDNEQRVQTRTLDWSEIVRREWGKDYVKPEPGYEFTGHKFDTPTNGGPYSDE